MDLERIYLINVWFLVFLLIIYGKYSKLPTFQHVNKAKIAKYCQNSRLAHQCPFLF